MFLLDMKCQGMTAGIDEMIPSFVSSIVTLIQIAIPVILIVLGMLDLGKAVTSNDEKQMKEAQKTLIKRIIYAVLIFFVIAIVKFVFGVLGDAQTANDKTADKARNCIDCFLNYNKDEVKKACKGS